MLPCKECACDLFTVTIDGTGSQWLACFGCGTPQAAAALPVSRWLRANMYRMPQTGMELHVATHAYGPNRGRR